LKILKKEGLDYACISSGGIIPTTNMKFFSGFRIRMAKKIKKESGLIIRTSGLIDNFSILNKILKKDRIDLVAIGRKFINDKFYLYKYNKIYRNNKINIQNWVFDDKGGAVVNFSYKTDDKKDKWEACFLRKLI
jgi:2,4-dienoyl-CoA reductase-like NADH-dependent reductase (Old Yellow Enzyme family)